MIYTQQGEPVRIWKIRKGIRVVVTVISEEDPNWIREKYADTLKADDGLREIHRAMAVAQEDK